MKLFGEILLLSESISLVLASLTTVAVIWSIRLYFLQKRNTQRRDEAQERQEEIAVLVALHQHFLTCCKVLELAWDRAMPHRGLPSSGVPTLAIEEILETATKRLRNDPEMIGNIIHVHAEHCLLNGTWKLLGDSIANQNYGEPFASTFDRMKKGMPQTYQHTWICLKACESHLKLIAPRTILEYLRRSTQSLRPELGDFPEA